MRAASRRERYCAAHVSGVLTRAGGAAHFSSKPGRNRTSQIRQLTAWKWLVFPPRPSECGLLPRGAPDCLSSLDLRLRQVNQAVEGPVDAHVVRESRADFVFEHVKRSAKSSRSLMRKATRYVGPIDNFFSNRRNSGWLTGLEPVTFRSTI